MDELSDSDPGFKGLSFVADEVSDFMMDVMSDSDPYLYIFTSRR
jgi:hypothetical protein